MNTTTDVTTVTVLIAQLATLHSPVAMNDGIDRCPQCDPRHGIPCPTATLIRDAAIQVHDHG